MYLVNAQQMRQVDRFAMEKIGIPGIVLMETAGQQVVSEIEKRWHAKKILVIAGHGNNGGDAFVTARHLANRGYDVKAWLVGKKEKMTADCSTAYHAFINSKFSVERFTAEDNDRFRQQVMEADLIVDGMLGTGTSGPLRDPIPSIVTTINQYAAGKIVAIDIPTGVEADSGAVLGDAIQADLTVTFAYPKWGHYLFPGAEFCGEIAVKDISIPSWVSDVFHLTSQLLDDAMVAAWLPERRRHSHKGTYGHVLLIAGSKEFIGAPALAARGALHSGAGMVTMALPETIQHMVAGQIAEAVFWPWQAVDGAFSEDSCKVFAQRNGRYACTVVGPGIGQRMGVDWLAHILNQCSGPILLDADALNLLVGHQELLMNRKQLVITPHPGEMARLLGMTVPEIEQIRPEIARQTAVKYQLYVVLKGTYPIVATPEGKLYVSPRGSSSLAKGGSGDVLSGMIASFAGQKGNLLHGILLGVYLHGMAGEFMDEYSGLASDIGKQIGKAISHLRERR